MVALTGGLFISLAVFALARDSGRFYQREARIANATVGGLLGFERLRTDIARAGFLASPNVVRDPRLCGPPQPNWPSALRNLAAIQITAGAPNAALTLNGRTPPVIVLAGSYASADLFSVRVQPAGNSTTFLLESNQPALLRLGNQANPDNTTMQSVFANGRALRIVQNGRQYYGQITGSNGGASPSVTIGPAPAIQFRSGSLLGCGLEPWGSGASVATINVVNFIQYQLGTPQTAVGQASYQDVYASSDGGPGEAQRTELMRVELALDGTPIPGTEEIVAEYAVDLNLQLTAVSAITGCCNPTLSVISATDPLFPVFSAPVFGAANNTPERIRSVRVRLGVRSREGDRAATVTNPVGQGLFRFDLGTGTSEAFARVRTFQADVALHNQADILW
jgi:hypothetical protein